MYGPSDVAVLGVYRLFRYSCTYATYPIFISSPFLTSRSPEWTHLTLVTRVDQTPLWPPLSTVLAIPTHKLFLILNHYHHPINDSLVTNVQHTVI